MNTKKYSPRSNLLYATGVSLSPPESLTQTASQSVQPFLPGSLGDRLTDRMRDHALVGNNRRSAQWRSQTLLLSIATTSIYWSRWLNRSDHLQQSAAIFSCKTRRVAVYVKTVPETHYNIASKRAFITGIPDRWHNCLLYIDAQAV